MRQRACGVAERVVTINPIAWWFGRLHFHGAMREGMWVPHGYPTGSLRVIYTVHGELMDWDGQSMG